MKMNIILAKYESWINNLNTLKDDDKVDSLHKLSDQYKYLDNNQKIALNNIIIYKKIKDKFIDKTDDEKIKLMLQIHDSIVNKSNTLFNNEYEKNKYNKNQLRIIFNIANINNILKRKYNKELIMRDSVKKQQFLEKAKKRYYSISVEDRKLYRITKKNNKIKKIGLENYIIKQRESYRKWYYKLSEQSKNKIRIRRKIRYNNMDPESKLRLKIKRRQRFQLMSIEKKKKIIERRKEIYNNLTYEEKILYRNKISERRKKKIILKN